MRTLLIGVIAAVALVTPAAPAAAAQGHKAQFSISITLGKSFFRQIDPKHKSALQPGDFTIPPVTGVLYLTDKALRMDLSDPAARVTSTLIDFPSRTSYMIDHQRKLAWRMAAGAESDDLPLFNLEQMAANWERVYEQLGRKRGLSVKKLGSKKISGQSCRGLQISGDLGKLLRADEVQVAPGIPSLQNMKGQWQGTFWVSDKLAVPLRMTSSYMGMNLTWQVKGLSAWDVPESMLRVPTGYAVKDLDTTQMTQELSGTSV